MENELHFERIDGEVYEWGSPEHARAIDAGIRDRVQRLQASRLGERLDAAQTAFVARDLLYIQRDMQKVLYQKLSMARLVPIKSDVPRGAKQWAYRQMDIRGEAKVGAHLGTDDAPTADVGVEEFLFDLAHVTASYTYTLDELEAAAFANIPLQRDKAEACAEIIARGIDRVLRIGDDAIGITGFLNNPFVPVVAATNGAWASTATADDMIEDVSDAEGDIITQSGDNHRGTRLLLPSAEEGALVSTKVSTAGNMSVKKYILENNRGLKEIERYIALDGATGPSGVTDPPFGVLYDPDPMNVYAEVPIPYEELPPEARNYGWVVNGRALVGGVVFKRPLSAAYLEALD